MNQPLVSIIMPVYNGSKHLRKAMESMLNQTYTNFEFIIINDGSSDDSESIIQSYKDDRIVYIKNPQNLKLIRTLNKGIERATGKYIVRMDCDDISLPNRLERQVTFMEEHSEYGFCNGRAYEMSENGKILRESYPAVYPKSMKLISLFYAIIIHPSVIIQTEILKKNPYRDETNILHIEDYELWNRLQQQGYSCYSMEKPVLKYRWTAGNISSTQSSAQHKKQVEYIVQHIKQWYGITIQKKEILYFFLGETEYYYPGILKELDDLFALYIRKNVSTCTQKEIAEFKKWKNLMLLRRIKETAFMQFKSKDYTKMVYTIMKGKRYFYLLPFIALKKLNYFSI